MRSQLLASLRAMVVFTVLLGLAYPLVVTGVAQVAMPGLSDGSLLHRDGTVVGSRLIGQSFTGDQWFHPRPSAAGDGYDTGASSASNLGPTNPELISTVSERAEIYRTVNGLEHDEKVPVDAVTASGSGLDPEISVANARHQAARVARARGLDVGEVLADIDRHTSGRILGFLGEPGVNVVELNLALEAKG